MKSRWTTYLLVAAVLTVWGVVAWRVVFSRPEMPATVVVKPAVRPASKPEDDFLLLDYGDPFMRNVGGRREVQTPVAVIQTAPRAAATTPPKKPRPQQKPPIKYAGTIARGGTISHIFEHAGLLHTLSPGDEIAGYTLTEAFTDSVRMTKNDEEFIIKIVQ